MPKSIVLANGCFDMLHYGHLLHLEQAKAMGDELWVSITDDRHVLKGAGRPIYPEDHRLAMVRALRMVDKAFLVSSLIEAIDFAKPAILCKGTDYRQGLHEVHENYCKKRGIQICYTTTPKMSATEMIRIASGSERHQRF